MHELWSERYQLYRLVFKSFWWMCCWMCKSVPSGTSSSWGKMYTPSFIAYSQKTTPKINKNGAIAKVRISVELEINYKAFKTFRIISNEMRVLLLLLIDNILVICRCIQRNFLMFTFMSKHFLKALWQRETHVNSFEK